MDLKFSKVTRKGPITTITLSRPEVYNALRIDAPNCPRVEVHGRGLTRPRAWERCCSPGATATR